MDNVDKTNAEEIMVSVVIATWNHERYIEKAIRSVLMQKVNFKYEVLIGEDCSPDSTADVLRRLEPELPDNYHIFYREVNYGGSKNFNDLFDRAEGKYMIILEGDDYWLYEYKLQKQVDFLEANPDYVAIAHNMKMVDQNDNEKVNHSFLECKKEEYTLYDYREGFFAGQTATVMFRNYYKYKQFPDIPLRISWMGDMRKNFLFPCWGKVKVIQEQWSAYRQVTGSGTSFSATLKKDTNFYNKQLIFYEDLKDYAEKVVQREDAIKVAETLYLVNYLKCVKRKSDPTKTLSSWIKEFYRAKYKLSYFAHRLGRIKNSILKHFR